VLRRKLLWQIISAIVVYTSPEATAWSIGANPERRWSSHWSFPMEVMEVTCPDGCATCPMDARPREEVVFPLVLPLMEVMEVTCPDGCAFHRLMSAMVPQPGDGEPAQTAMYAKGTVTNTLRNCAKATHDIMMIPKSH